MAKKQQSGAKGDPKKGDGKKIIAKNRRASYEYHLSDRYEAGLVLTGTEVKSLRTGQANIGDAYARIDGNELYVYKMYIPEYEMRGYANHEPRRRRKLLVHKQEIRKLTSKLVERGLTLIPTILYFKDGYAKLEIALAQGKKLHDKRESMKKKSADRELRRIVR